MKGEVHVLIIRLPLEELVAEAQQQVPKGYELVDSEFVDNDAAYFSFQQKSDEQLIELEGNEEAITIYEEGD